ncbi:hypothetical protein LLG39_14830 [bacterium]|nr:hypothetical protein [bacterium]
MENLQRHNTSPDLQALAIAVAATDIVRFFNDWVWTYDPRLTSPFVPMVLFPRQAEFLHWIEEREAQEEDGIAEKSRDMGLTWLCAGFLTHHWLFREGFKGSIGSRKLQLVDTLGDPDSIIEKIRLILRYLPKWMYPAGWDPKTCDNFCKLINPANGSTITGEAGDEIGRGGRSSIYIVDEAAFLARPQKVEAALSANTKCRIYVSTPNGNGNPFAKKRASGKVAVFTMHWKDDPRKNAWQIVRQVDEEVIGSGPGGSSPPAQIPDGCIIRYPWYEAEKERLRDPVTVAQELDIDYTASVEGIAIPAKWVQAAVNLHKRITLPQSQYAVAGLDVADGGGCESVLTIRRGAVVVDIHSRNDGGTTDTANWALDLSQSAGVSVLNYDCIGVGAGIAGTYEARSRSEDLKLSAVAINVGVPATETMWPDGKTAREKFVNLKAELWWTARTRFEKTYEFVEAGVEHPIDELISIPDDPRLISQLSNVLHFKTETGKVQIETKQQLSRRGVASPDFAESFMLTLAQGEVTTRVARPTILVARTR